MNMKELKITDVMVGDWVDVRNNASPYTPHFERITPSHFFRDEYWYGVKLVPEILEKNGFKVRNRYIWEQRDNYCCVKLSIAPKIEIDGEILDEHPPIMLEVDGATFSLNVIVEYVHKLQHALKLCGIEKEIEI